VYLETGGSITNNQSGMIFGNKFGAFLEGAFGTITNNGTIAAPSYDGVVVGRGGVVTNGAGASIAGGTNGVLVKYRAAGTVENFGTISASGTNGAGVDLSKGGIVENYSLGVISGTGFGIFMTGDLGMVTNNGRISGSHGVAVELGGTVTNTASASISGSVAGIFSQGQPAALTNFGDISATASTGAGADIEAGGSIANEAGASLSGGAFGVFLAGSMGTVANYGSITGYHGVAFEAGGRLTNGSGASISGNSAGVFSKGATVTVENSGSIHATGAAGLDIESGGNVTNNSGASISGSSFGIFMTGSTGTISNFGGITGYHGIAINAGGSVINGAGGSIFANSAGIFSQGAPVSITNAGSITARGAAGADIEAGGSITNSTGAVLSGNSFGVFLSGGSGTVENSGTISGPSYAIDFSNSFADRLIIHPGAVFVGNVKGGSGSNTLELATGAGSINGIGTPKYSNFQNGVIDANADWILTGSNVLPNLLDNGIVSIGSSLVVSTAVDPSSFGSFILEHNAVLEIAAAQEGSTAIDFQGGSELVVDNTNSFGLNVGSQTYSGPQLQNFTFDDVVDLKNFGSSGAAFSYDSATGVLQLSNGLNQTASLSMQDSTLGSGAFHLAGDGATGTLVTHS
jgi:hypothetical protein